MDGMTQTLADIRDLDRLVAAVQGFSPNIVIHMAAQSLVRRSYRQPLETYAVNVMGTAQLLEAVRRVSGVEATLVVTSDKCYENREDGRPFREDDPMGGHDPYSSSKGCAELVTAAYACSFAPGPVASVRAGNVIGGGDWSEDRLLPDVFRALCGGGTALLRNPLAIRPWQHVLEPLSGYLTAAEHLVSTALLPRRAWNFGPEADSELTVAMVARRCAELWGSPDAIVEAPAVQGQHEARMLRLDSTRAREELGWVPRWNLEETLRRTTEWYRAFSRGSDMRAVTLAQIAAYQSARAE
jgi:CDP-glucose 4,6-dehydratase